MKNPNIILAQGDVDYEKYLKLSNQMNTNELQDVFIGRMERVLAALGKDREKIDAKHNNEESKKQQPVSSVMLISQTSQRDLVKEPAF